MSRVRFALTSAAVLAACGRPVTSPAPDASAIAREFRGVWVATVRNIDWPSRTTLTADEQRAELVDILDRAAGQGYNAVILQVRPAADAVYRSDLEPWSVLLSGQQGTDPGYDPLEFAVREAHARGLELHAWINPFRAGNAADTLMLAPTHLWNTRRDLVRVYGAQLWMDPGAPEAREHSLRVVTDIVRRYDIDAIHMDDYFYPYPVRDPARGGNVPFPDSATYAALGAGTTLNDWRRSNIDRFVEAMYRESHALRPMVKVGISPFGIWRPGHPPSVAGLDAYDQIFADAKKWLQDGSVDYLAPQLYWADSAERQSFSALYDWWLAQNTLGRHIWPGMATYRAGSGASNGFALTEIADQVKIVRARPVAHGYIMYNGTTTLKRPHFSATIAPLFAMHALPPRYPWLDSVPPAAPSVAVAGHTITIMPAGETPRWWRVSARTDSRFFGRSRATTRLVFGMATRVTVAFEPQVVTVHAIDQAGNASDPARWHRATDERPTPAAPPSARR